MIFSLTLSSKFNAPVSSPLCSRSPAAASHWSLPPSPADHRDPLPPSSPPDPFVSTATSYSHSLRNMPYMPARETSRLNSLSLLSSKSNPTVSSPGLQQTTSLSPFPGDYVEPDGTPFFPSSCGLPKSLLLAHPCS